MIRSFILLLLSGISLVAAPVDTIVSARYVLPMNASGDVIENGAVAIRGSDIVAVGKRADIDRDYQAKQRIDAGDAIVAPGLINTHTHAAMSLFRGIADDMNLQDWLQKFIFPAEARNVNADFVRWGTRLACLEMIESGTTTYTDMYYFEDVVAEVTKEAGMRGVLGETIIGFPVADAKTSADSLRFTEKYIQRFKNDPLVVPAVAPHAVYTNSDKNLKASRDLAVKYQVPLLIHVSETRKENDDLKAKRNVTPTQLLDQLHVFDARTVAAHGVWVDENDREIMKRDHVGVAHCPSSNTKLASGIAPVMAYLHDGVNIALGTDGVAGSNNDVDMFEEMDLAAKLQKVTTMDPTALNARQALEMATIDGARVLGMEKQIGSLEAGKRADLIVVSLSEPNAVPLYNVYSQMVYALKAADVKDVVINGRLIMKDRRVLTLNAGQIYEKAREYRDRIRASLAKQ